MAVQDLINQIIIVHQLTGGTPESIALLRKELDGLNEAQLSQKLAEALSNSQKLTSTDDFSHTEKEEQDEILAGEKTVTIAENGDEITEIRNGEELLQRIIKHLDESGKVFETMIYFANGKPVKRVKKEDGNKVESNRYEFSEDEEGNEIITIKTTARSLTSTNTEVKSVDENGDYTDDDFISRDTESLLTGEKSFVKKEENGFIYETKYDADNNVISMKKYNGSSISDYENGKLSVERELVKPIIEEDITGYSNGLFENDVSSQIHTIQSHMHTLKSGHNLGKLNYDKQSIKNFFASLGSPNSEWKQDKNNPNIYTNGTSTIEIGNNKTHITSLNGAVRLTNQSEKSYKISIDGDSKSSTYVFDGNGNFQYEIVCDYEKNPNTQTQLYDDGTFTLAEFNENGKIAARQVYNDKGKVIAINSYNYDDNGNMESLVTIFTENYKSNPNYRNKMVVQTSNGDEYIYKKGENGEYNVLDEIVSADSIPIMDSKNKVVGYMPYGKTVISPDGYVQRANAVSLHGTTQCLKEGERLDYSPMTQSVAGILYNTLLERYETAKMMIENSQKEDNVADGSYWLDKVLSLTGHSKEDLIKEMADGIKNTKALMDFAEGKSNLSFEEAYKKATGRNLTIDDMDNYIRLNQEINGLRINLQAIFNEYEKNKYPEEDSWVRHVFADINGGWDEAAYTHFLSEVYHNIDNSEDGNPNFLATTLGQKRFSELSAICMDKTHADLKAEMAQTENDLINIGGNILDIAAMVLEFGAISKVYKLASTGIKALKVGNKVRQISPLLESAHNFLKGESKFAKGVRYAQSLTPGMVTFGAYDGIHAISGDLSNGRDVDWGNVLHQTLKGAALGGTAGGLNRAISTPIIKKYYKCSSEEIEEEIAKMLKKSKGSVTASDIAKKTAELKVTPSFGRDPALKTVLFSAEVGTFSFAASTINLIDRTEITESLKAGFNYTDEQINKMSTLDLIEESLKLQGEDVENNPAIINILTYAINEYKNQYIGLGQMKLVEAVIGMMMTKGKTLLPSGMSEAISKLESPEGGRRYKALKFERNKDGEWYDSKDPQKTPLSESQMQYKVHQAMTFDTIESILNNNDYKNRKISGKEFSELVMGKDTRNSNYDNLEGYSDRVMLEIVDGKYEITTPDGKKEVFDELEDIVNIYLQATQIEHVANKLGLDPKFIALLFTSTVREGIEAKEGTNAGGNENISNGLRTPSILETPETKTFMSARPSGEKDGVKEGVVNGAEEPTTDKAPVQAESNTQIDDNLYAQVRENIEQNKEAQKFLNYYDDLDVNYLIEAVTKNSNNDPAVINRRLDALHNPETLNLLADAPSPEFILDHIHLIREIDENIEHNFAWESDTILSMINEENLPEILDVSRKVAQDDEDAINHMSYILYSRVPHEVVYGNDIVEVDTKALIYIVSRRKPEDIDAVKKELYKLFAPTENKTNRKDENALDGIMEQHPELFDLALKLKDLSPEDFIKFVDNPSNYNLPKTMKFRTFEPSESNLEGHTVIEAYAHMKKSAGTELEIKNRDLTDQLVLEGFTKEERDALTKISEDLDISASEAINVVKRFGYNNTEKLEILKTLRSIKLTPNEYMSPAEKEYFQSEIDFNNALNLTTRIKDLDDAETLKILLENNASIGFMKTLTPTNYKYSNVDLKMMGDYIKAIGNNQNLIENINISFVKANYKYINLIREIAKSNPNITEPELRAELGRRLDVNSTLNVHNKTQHFQNDALRDIARALKGRYLAELDDLDLKYEDVYDTKLQDYIETKLKECQALVSETDIDYTKLNEILSIVNEYLDIYHTLHGTYEMNAEGKERKAYKEKKLELEPDAQQLFDMAEKGIKIDNSEFNDYTNEPTIEVLRNYLECIPNDEMADHFYKEYYLGRANIPNEIKERCINIADEYGVKIILTSDLSIADKYLDFAKEEFAHWKQKSGGNAKYPPVINFSKIKAAYIDETSAYGQGLTGGYAKSATDLIGINGMDNLLFFKNAIRHEMTHINDTKKKSEYTEYENIMPHTTNEKGVSVPDFKNCKYREEFLKAGISSKHILYAYNSPQEFIAVAAEGDMSRYSEEFKALLVDMGMPKWQLDFETQDDSTKSRVATMDKIIDYMDGTNIPGTNNFEDLEFVLQIYQKSEYLATVVSNELRRQNIPNNPMAIFHEVMNTGDMSILNSDTDTLRKILENNNSDESLQNTYIGEGNAQNFIYEIEPDLPPEKYLNRLNVFNTIIEINNRVINAFPEENIPRNPKFLYKFIVDLHKSGISQDIINDKIANNDYLKDLLISIPTDADLSATRLVKTDFELFDNVHLASLSNLESVEADAKSKKQQSVVEQPETPTFMSARPEGENGGAKEPSVVETPETPTFMSARPNETTDGTNHNHKILSQAEVDILREIGEKITIKDDGTVLKFDPIMKKTVVIGIIKPEVVETETPVKKEASSTSPKRTKEEIRDIFIGGQKYNLQGVEYIRFTNEELDRLVELAMDDFDFVKKLVDEKYRNWSNEIVPRFDAEEITELVELSKNNKDLANRLISDKTRHIISGDEINRHNFEEIRDLLNAAKEDAALVNKLLDEKTKNWAGKENYRFNDDEIVKLVELSKINRNVFDSLIDAKQDNRSKYDVFAIENILKRIENKQLDQDVEKMLAEEIIPDEKYYTDTIIDFIEKSNEIEKDDLGLYKELCKQSCVKDYENNLTPKEKDFIKKLVKDMPELAQNINIIISLKSKKTVLDESIYDKIDIINNNPDIGDVPDNYKYRLLACTKEELAKGLENLHKYMQTHPDTNAETKLNIISLDAQAKLCGAEIDSTAIIEKGIYDDALEILGNIDNAYYIEQILFAVNMNASIETIKHNFEYIKSQQANGKMNKLSSVRNILSFDVDFQARKQLLSSMNLPIDVSRVLLRTEDISDIETIKNTINILKTFVGDIKNPVEVAKFLNRNKDIDLKDLNNYFSKIDKNKISEIAPEFANFNDAKIMQFVEYHYKNDKNKTEFTKEDLELTPDFTTFLARNYVDAETMSVILSAFPLTNRNIGNLPEGWLEKVNIADYEKVNSQIQNIIDNFRTTRNTSSLEDALSKVLLKNVSVTELGGGSLGVGYKISVDNCESVVLKIFLNEPDFQHPLHGKNIEPQTGMFLNENSDEYVHMYFGRVTSETDNDGYLVTQFAGDEVSSYIKGTKNPKYKIDCEDAYGDQNIINGRIIDYGDVHISNADGTDARYKLPDKKSGMTGNVELPEQKEKIRDIFAGYKTSFRGEEIDRFDSEELDKLTELAIDNFDFVKKLVDEKFTLLANDKRVRFNVSEIEKLVALAKIDYELVNRLVDEKRLNILNNLEPRFNAYNIELLFDVQKDNPVLFDALLSKKHSNNDKKPRFNYDQIVDLMSYGKTSEYADMILDLINDSDYEYDHIIDYVCTSNKVPKDELTLYKAWCKYGLSQDYSSLTPKEKNILKDICQKRPELLKGIELIPKLKQYASFTNRKIDDSFVENILEPLSCPEIDDIDYAKKCYLVDRYTEEEFKTSIQYLKKCMESHPDINNRTKFEILRLINEIKKYKNNIDMTDMDTDLGAIIEKDIIIDLIEIDNLETYGKLNYIKVLPYINLKADKTTLKNNINYIKDQQSKQEITTNYIRNILQFNVDYKVRKSQLDKMYFTPDVAEVLLHTEDISNMEALTNIMSSIRTVTQEIKDPIEFAKFLNRNSDILDDMSDYISKINLNELTQLAPRLAKFTDSELLKFIEYHYKNDKNKTEFTKEDLDLTPDFTAFLAKNYVDARGMNDILTAYPMTDRNIGRLPEGWLENVSENDYEGTNKKIQDIIDNFRTSRDTSYLESALSKLLRKNVNVTVLGEGSFGTGYKVSVDNSIDVVLKIFHAETLDPDYYIVHGAKIEPQTGMFLNENSDEFAYMFFGRVCGANDTDGYLVTQFITRGIEPYKERTNNPNYFIKSNDATFRNVIDGTIIDFGDVVVRNPDFSKIKFNIFDTDK